MSTAVHITWHGAQIILRDLPPYLTYGAHLEVEEGVSALREAALQLRPLVQLEQTDTASHYNRVLFQIMKIFKKI